MCSAPMRRTIRLRNRWSQWGQRFRRRIVRRMGVHEMQPQEKWLLSERAHPFPGPINQNLSSRRGPQCPPAIARWRSFSLLIFEVEIVIEPSERADPVCQVRDEPVDPGTDVRYRFPAFLSLIRSLRLIRQKILKHVEPLRIAEPA